MTLNPNPPIVQKVFVSREEYVYETIREYVISGRLKPQQEINQAELAHQLAVSIIPVRNAISRLIAEGFLIQQGHYQSPQVFSLTKAELEEVLVICAHLEVLATSHAIPNLTPTALSKLQQILDKMDSEIASGHLLQFGALNREFHMAIYKHSKMPRLTQMIQDLWQKADIYRFRAMFDLLPELAQHAQQEHRLLLDDITSVNNEEAKTLMGQHKEYSRNAFLLTFDNLAPLVSEADGEAL